MAEPVKQEGQETAAPEGQKEKKSVAKFTPSDDSLLGSSNDGLEIVEQDIVEGKEADAEPKDKSAESKKESDKKETDKKDEIKEPAKDEKILGRFKTNADVDVALKNLSSEFSKVIDDVKSMERELGVKLFTEEILDTSFVKDDAHRIELYRKLERLYTIATQKRSEARKQLATFHPDDELLKKKTDEELDLEWTTLQKDPKNTIIKTIRSEVQRLLEMDRRKIDIVRKETEEDLSRVKGEIEKFKESNPAYVENEKAIHEYINKNIPVGSNLPAQTILKLALDAVSGTQSKSEVKKQLDDAQRKQSDEDEKDKRAASVLNGSGAGGGSARMDKSTPSAENEIANSILNAEAGGIFD